MVLLLSIVSYLVSWSYAQTGFYFVDPQGPEGVVCDPALDIYEVFEAVQQEVIIINKVTLIS